MNTLKEWEQMIGSPQDYSFSKEIKLIKKYSFNDIDCELYLQSNGVHSNGEITYQRVMIAFPKELNKKLPGIVVPFYYPEAALGFDPETMLPLPKYSENPIMAELVRRGYVAISADSYHLSYIDSTLSRSDFKRWSKAAEALYAENPDWTGVGKLIADTKLLIDVLENDPRVDSNKIAIAGHSLGGKMAFYTGCLDSRIKVIIASDFGIGWEQTNWEEAWYWGNKLKELKEQGFSNSQLLAYAAPKPFCLIAGKFDDDNSRKILYSVKEYNEFPQKLLIIDHRAGHRPPKYARDAAYGFLDFWINEDN